MSNFLLRTFRHQMKRWDATRQRFLSSSSGRCGKGHCKIHAKDIVNSGVSVEIPKMTLDEFIWKDADKWSQKIAMECVLTGRKYTYGQCRLMTRRFEGALQKLGRKPGEVIAIVSPNIPEFPIICLGANAAGLIVTLVNPTYTKDEIQRQLQDSDTRTVVTINLFVPVVQAASKSLKRVESVIVVGEPEEGCHSFMDLMKDGAGKFSGLQGIPGRKDDDLVALPYSSGTTGIPKGVMLTHRNIVSNISQSVHPEYSNILRATGNFQESVVAVLPFFHIYGLVAVMYATLYVGGRVLCVPKFEPEMFIRTLAEYKPTAIFTVPPLLNFLASNPAIKDEHLKSVKTLTCGGAPAGSTLIAKVMDRFHRINPVFLEGYGLTETSPVVTLLKVKAQKEKRGSAGTVIPGTDVAIVDVTTLESLGPKKIGELFVRGPQVMKGYWKNPKATLETMDGEWFKTGDLGYYDDEKYFFIVDRMKELIKVKGFQVAPSELENILRKHPAVMDCAVFGVPDEMSGELPKALIVLRSGKTITADDIHAYLKDKVSEKKYLKGGIVFVDAIPRNASGKILRKDLKTMEF